MNNYSKISFKSILHLPLFVLFFLSAQALNKGENISLKPQHTIPFSSGEYMRFKVGYGVIGAGEAELKIGKVKDVRGAKAMHIVGTGKSFSFFDLFFKVRDRYETYFDPERKVPVEFVRHIREGGYEKKQHYQFDHDRQQAIDVLKNPGKRFPIDTQSQDMLSAFYYARTLDFNGVKEGDMVHIPTFLDDEMYQFYLRFNGREVLKTKWGKVKTMSFTPVVQQGRVFSDKESMKIWVTDDSARLPILLKSELKVGSIKFELTDYDGLSHSPHFY